MNMILKPTVVGAYKHTCGFGCCTDIRRGTAKAVRRAAKRRERAAWKKDIR